jgi:hypothetical protein
MLLETLMSAIELSSLKTGEPAYLIGSVAYALISKDGHMFRWSKLAYEGANLSIMEAGMFTGSFSERVDSVEEFIARVEELKHHHDQQQALGRTSEGCKTNTPWGQADGVDRYVKGLNRYNTPGHGGFKVAATLNARIPEILRNADGWYEEDSEWAKIAFALPEFFTDFEKKHALSTVINWYPDEYEALTGKIIPEGQSQEKDKKLFTARNADNWVVISASSSKEHEGMVETWATKGGHRKEWNGPEIEEKRFLVPSTDYNSRQLGFGFVIDPAQHAEFTPGSTLKM